MKFFTGYVTSCLVVYCLFPPLWLTAQEPDLSRLNTSKEKITALLNYCATLQINNSGDKNNYTKMQDAAVKGLRLATTDDKDSRSLFLFYDALGYYYHVQFDSAQYYLYQSLRIAQKAQLVERITRTCVALIPVNFQLQQPEKVEECKKIVQSIVDTAKNETTLAPGYYALGSYYQQKSFYSTAQDYFIKSLQLREKTVDTTQDLRKKFEYAILCDMLSKLYLNTQMTDKSIEILRQGMRFAGVSPNVSNRLFSSFVEAYTTSGNIDSAIYYSNKLADATKSSGGFPSEIVSSNLNIGIFYLDHNDTKKALPFIEKGDSLATIIKSPYLIFQAQMIKGRYFEEAGKYDEAVALLSQSLPIAKQLSKELTSSINKSLALAEKGKGNLKEAIAYYEQYAQQSDSLSKEKLETNFADQETRYQTNQKEQRIESLNNQNRLTVLELQNASRTKLFLILGLAAFGIIALLLYFIYRNKEKVNNVLNRQKGKLETLNSQLTIANETKAKLFSIIGHDLRSPVSQVVQLLQLQKESPAFLSEETKSIHEERLKNASENVLETMEDLLLWSKSQMQHFSPLYRNVKIDDIVSKEANLLQKQAEDKNIQIHQLVHSGFIQNTDENFISVIIRNLLQNALKYSDNDSVITIATKNNNLVITNQSSQTKSGELNALLDSKQVDSKKSGLGLQIANDLSVAINAKIFFTQTDENYLSAILQWNNE